MHRYPSSSIVDNDSFRFFVTPINNCNQEKLEWLVNIHEHNETNGTVEEAIQVPGIYSSEEEARTAGEKHAREIIASRS